MADKYGDVSPSTTADFSQTLHTESSDPPSTPSGSSMEYMSSISSAPSSERTQSYDHGSEQSTPCPKPKATFTNAGTIILQEGASNDTIWKDLIQMNGPDLSVIIHTHRYSLGIDPKQNAGVEFCGGPFGLCTDIFEDTKEQCKCLKPGNETFFVTLMFWLIKSTIEIPKSFNFCKFFNMPDYDVDETIVSQQGSQKVNDDTPNPNDTPRSTSTPKHEKTASVIKAHSSFNVSPCNNYGRFSVLQDDVTGPSVEENLQAASRASTSSNPPATSPSRPSQVRVAPHGASHTSPNRAAPQTRASLSSSDATRCDTAHTPSQGCEPPDGSCHTSQPGTVSLDPGPLNVSGTHQHDTAHPAPQGRVTQGVVHTSTPRHESPPLSGMPQRDTAQAAQVGQGGRQAAKVGQGATKAAKVGQGVDTPSPNGPHVPQPCPTTRPHQTRPVAPDTPKPRPSSNPPEQPQAETMILFPDNLTIRNFGGRKNLIAALQTHLKERGIGFSIENRTDLYIQAHDKQSYRRLANMKTLNNKTIHLLPLESSSPKRYFILHKEPLGVVDLRRVIPQVTTVRRVMRRSKDNRLEPTDKIEFNATVRPPPFITIKNHQIEVREVNMALVRCYRCQGFGHLGIGCIKPIACAKCAEPHGTWKCEAPRQVRKCVRCQSTDHTAFWYKCPERLKQVRLFGNPRPSPIQGSVTPLFQLHTEKPSPNPLPARLPSTNPWCIPCKTKDSEIAELQSKVAQLEQKFQQEAANRVIAANNRNQPRSQQTQFITPQALLSAQLTPEVMDLLKGLISLTNQHQNATQQLQQWMTSQ